MMRLFGIIIVYGAIMLNLAAFGQGSVHQRIASPYQSDSTNIRILLPEKMKEGKKYKVLYVLPVRPFDTRPFGDGLLEIQKYNYHNKYDVICVAPEFTSIPWIADNDSIADKQNESHFIKTVIPFVEQNFPAQKNTEGRLLIGFSKSGVGAFTLLLRHPDLFAKAAGWDIGNDIDTGFMLPDKKKREIRSRYGSDSNFENYRISSLIKSNGSKLGPQTRLFLYNSVSSREKACVELHQIMVDYRINHRCLYEPARIHRWDSGWMPEAVRFLMDDLITN